MAEDTGYTESDRDNFALIYKDHIYIIEKTPRKRYEYIYIMRVEDILGMAVGGLSFDCES